MADLVFEQYVNVDEALARMRGNKKLYRRMLGLYLESAEFGALEAAIAQRDIKKAAEIAHAIKGIAGNMSLPILFKISTSLMESLNAGTPDEALIESFYQAQKTTRGYVERLVLELDAQA